jgi:hypothetical protein
MGLSQTITATTTASQKQICAGANSSGAVVYTVPNGKKFVGYCSHERTYSGSGYHARIVNPDGGEVAHTGGFSSFSASNFPQGSTTVELTLLAGTSVKNQGGSNYTYVFGVESDA